MNKRILTLSEMYESTTDRVTNRRKAKYIGEKPLGTPNSQVIVYPGEECEITENEFGFYDVYKNGLWLANGMAGSDLGVQKHLFELL